MNSPTQTPPNRARRQFLQQVVAGGGALAAGAAVAGTLQVSDLPGEAQARSPEPPRSSGYRETDHVRRYYETTRI